MKSPLLSTPYFAAVDLGSNSFHMVVARLAPGGLEIVDREKDMVQLARGIGPDGRLSEEAQSRALDCLRRFAERLRGIPPAQVRAVGTRTLRSTRRPERFLALAEAALGVPIQVISGFEEARLIYSGLAHSVSDDGGRRLVVDIGGGSTEFIIGEHYEPQLLESLGLGCVTYTSRFIGESAERASGLRRAYLAACAEIETIRGEYRQTGWQKAYGTSGTVKAIAELLARRDGGAVIAHASLRDLAQALQEGKVPLDSLSSARRAVLPAGVMILLAIFDQLGIEVLHVGDAALKEGLLWDSVGRLESQDRREATVRQLQARYRVDSTQAERVAKLALTFWRQTGGPKLPGVSRSKILRWAALLHEAGMSLSHTSHQEHGYYLLRHGDLAGFGRYEQAILANLVRLQRKGLAKHGLEELGPEARAAFLPLLVCLRLAVLLHRRREDLRAAPDLVLNGERSYRLVFPPGWLEAHPLSLAGLRQEQDYYARAGLGLEFQS